MKGEEIYLKKLKPFVNQEVPKGIVSILRQQACELAYYIAEEGRDPEWAIAQTRKHWGGRLEPKLEKAISTAQVQAQKSGEIKVPPSLRN